MYLPSLVLYAHLVSSLFLWPLHISLLNRNLSNNKISLLRNGSFYGLAALEKL